MAVMRERPYSGCNFLVSLGGNDARSLTAGFSEVVFPVFHIDPGRSDEATQRLILKRGLIGSLDLFTWWNQANSGKAPRRRTVKIELLSEDQATVVMTWRFAGVRPMSLHYSPLQATHGGVVMETLELAFESMEMA